MNKVYLSGRIASKPTLVNKEGADPHLLFQLCVTHKNARGVQEEFYRINAWRDIALWGRANLQKEQIIAMHGYLTQKKIRFGEQTIISVDVTADEFIGQAARTDTDCTLKSMA